MTNLAWETPFELTQDKSSPSHMNTKLKDTSNVDMPIELSREKGPGEQRKNRSSATSNASSRRREHQTRKPSERTHSGTRKVHRTRTHDGATTTSASSTGSVTRERHGHGNRRADKPPSPPTLQRSKSLQDRSNESRPLRRHRRHEHENEHEHEQSPDNRSTTSGTRRSPSMSRSSGRKDRGRGDRHHSREGRRTGAARTNSSRHDAPVRRRVSHSDKRAMRRNPPRTKSEELAGSDGGDRMRYYRERVHHHPHRDAQVNSEPQHQLGRRERQDGSHRRPGPRRAKSYVDRPAALTSASSPHHRDSKMPPLVSRQSFKAPDPLFDPKLVGLLAHQADESEHEHGHEQKDMGPEILLNHDDDSASVISDYDEDEEDDPLAFIKSDFGYGAPKATLIANDAEKNPSLFTALSKVESIKRDAVKQSDEDDNHSVGSEGTAATTSSTLSFAKEKLSHAKKKVAGSLLKLVSGPNPNKKAERIISSNHASRGITIMGPMLKLGTDDEEEEDDEDFY